jgi:predicted deacylase
MTSISSPSPSPSPLFTTLDLNAGSNHGDEYEGPVSLLKLARCIDPAQAQGRILLMPALNLPAVQANTPLPEQGDVVEAGQPVGRVHFIDTGLRSSARVQSMARWLDSCPSPVR